MTLSHSYTYRQSFYSILTELYEWLPDWCISKLVEIAHKDSLRTEWFRDWITDLLISGRLSPEPQPGWMFWGCVNPSNFQTFAIFRMSGRVRLCGAFFVVSLDTVQLLVVLGWPYRQYCMCPFFLTFLYVWIFWIFSVKLVENLKIRPPFKRHLKFRPCNNKENANIQCKKTKKENREFATYGLLHWSQPWPSGPGPQFPFSVPSAFSFS